MVVCKGLIPDQYFNESVLSIGSFDGMHRGHIEIISGIKTISKSKNIQSVVITFEPHPKTILHAYGQSIQPLMSLDKKIELLEKHEVDYVWVIPFDKKFSEIPAEVFLKKYISAYFNPLDIIIGYDHHFGYNQEGNIEFLNNNKKAYKYTLHTREPILHQNIPISSSRIRSDLKCCNLDKANECLGREYEYSGRIIKGMGLGTQLEFPTANVLPHIPHQLIPSHGVYCVDAIIDSSYYTGMCNIGMRPTFYDDGKEIIEVHLFTKDTLNIYGKDIVVSFKKYLREEKKYNSTHELIKQLKLDRQACFSI